MLTEEATATYISGGSLNLFLNMQINPGGDIPEEYYLSNLMESSKKEMERVVVGRRSSYLISYHVDAPGSKLRYIYVMLLTSL